LGIAPEPAREGCLQDSHWFDGAFGYFPTSTLGAMLAAQLFAAVQEADAQIAPAIERGDFGPLLAWLRTHVQGQGRLRPAQELVVAATGRPLDPHVYLDHLRRRYTQ